jgi:uncharacterized protein YbjT (DUF2867 family)
VERGVEVRALVRTTAAVLPSGVESIAGDLTEPASLEPALAGVQGLFLLPGYRGSSEILATACAAGLEHVVQLSGRSAALGEDADAISAYMARSEAAARASGLAWTILRPSGFMSNTLQWAGAIRDGKPIRAPFANVAVAMIDPADIADIAAVAFTDRRGHTERIHEVSGPESLLPADRAKILGSVLGRQLRFEPQPDDEARAEMAAAMPDKYVEALFRFNVEGTLDESLVLGTVPKILGRPARTFEQWATFHAEAFTQVAR